MGQKSTDVAVIFNNDANQWVEYIKNHLKKIDQGKDEIKVFVSEDNDLFPMPHPKTMASLSSATVIVVIATPGFLASMQNDPKRQCMIKDPSNAILFLCGTTEEDITKSNLSGRFHSFEKWTKITHDKPEELFRCITANIDNVDNKPQPMCQILDVDDDEDIPIPDDGNDTGAVSADAAKTWSVDPKWAFDITPTVIHSEEQTEVVIFFQNKLPDTCQLKIVFDDIELPTHRRNPYTMCFIAPEHREGDVQAVLECDNGRVGGLTLKYMCEMEKMNGLIQIHLQALELICQQKGIGVTELDNTLSKIFVEKSDTIPVAAFENLFGMHEYAASMSIKHELPTLLHFAAKYGLKDFTCHLIDLPGALLAYSISNTSGDRPAEIARKNKHMELANYFDTYIEMNGTLYELMEPYMYFSIDTQWCETEEDYYNTQQPGYVGYDHPIPVGMPAEDIPGYLAMDKSMKKPFPMKRATTKKVPRPTHVPKTPRQKELYDIMMQLYESKITALEMKRQITEWFSRHAGGTSLKDKQKNLDELKKELKLWASQDREDAGYSPHSNKGEFIQYMLRQCMRQHGSPYYNTKARSGAGQDDQRQQPNEAEYMYTGPKSNPSEPTQGGGLSQVWAGNQQQSSVLQRNRPVSIRMDKLIQDKGIEATPPIPKRQSKPHSHHRDKPPKPIVSPPIKPDLPLRDPRTRLL